MIALLRIGASIYIQASRLAPPKFQFSNLSLDTVHIIHTESAVKEHAQI